MYKHPGLSKFSGLEWGLNTVADACPPEWEQRQAYIANSCECGDVDLAQDLQGPQ